MDAIGISIDNREETVTGHIPNVTIMGMRHLDEEGDHTEYFREMLMPFLARGDWL